MQPEQPPIASVGKLDMAVSPSCLPKSPIESPDVTRTDKITGIQTIGSSSEVLSSAHPIDISYLVISCPRSGIRGVASPCMLLPSPG
jgi:hypothetical protein